MNSDPRPCYGQGGPQCWGPPDQNCPDCGRSWGPPEPIRVAYSQAEIAERLTKWMLAEFGNPEELSAADRRGWQQRMGTIMHFIRRNFPDASGKYFQDYLDPNPES